MFRLIDMVLALTGLAICGIPMALIALAIRLHDGGPAFFLQSRVGKDLRIFTIYKFRSMRVEKDNTRSGEVSSNKQKAREQFKTTVPNDPRITPIGKFVRATHIDELPQILNVLKGEMSFVGVRPDTPAQELDYSQEYWIERHTLRPGITGTAQLGSGAIRLAERTELEKEWLQNASFNLYFLVLFRTFAKVIRRSGF